MNTVDTKPVIISDIDSVTDINQDANITLLKTGESADPYSLSAGLAFHRKMVAMNEWLKLKIATKNGLPEFPRYFHSSKDGSKCGKCGESYTDNQTIVLTGLNYIYSGHDNWNYQSYTICGKCAGDELLNSPFGITYTCEICQRKILGSKYNFQKGYVYCSKKCYWTIVNRRERSYELMIRSRKPTHCSICSTQFTTNRTDNRYCSNKCRQKAYRMRKTTLD